MVKFTYKKKIPKFNKTRKSIGKKGKGTKYQKNKGKGAKYQGNKGKGTKNQENKGKGTRKNKFVYSKKQYNSGDGMLTTVWGPSMWHFLHTFSFNFPVKPTKEDKKHYKDFIVSLQHVLPCKHCRINLKNNFKH